jgi:hypothetical protein
MAKKAKPRHTNRLNVKRIARLKTGRGRHPVILNSGV